jgi:hypothetical protein
MEDVLMRFHLAFTVLDGYDKADTKATPASVQGVGVDF